MPPAPLTLTTPPTLWAAWIRFLTKVRATISCSWKSTMSDKNLNKPCEGQDEPPLFLANRGRLLDSDSNYSLSLSPDSASCNFNLSVRRDCTSPDINTQSADGPILHPNNTIITLPQGKRFTNLENSLIASPDSSRINFWNDSLSFLSCQDSDRNKTFYKTASEGSNSEMASPDSVGMSSCRTSHRGSMDLSFSSAEMVVRSNSFVLDQQASVLSSLEESSAPPVSSHDESKSLLTPFSETGGAGDQAGDHPCFGMTFVFEDKMELPSEEHEATSNSSFLALPGEGENFSTTFLCKNSDIKNDTPFISSRSELLYESASLSEDSHRKSVDLSFSSAEMVVRGNSFILEEQAVPSLMSSFDESLAPPTSSHIESKSLLASAASVKDGAGDQAGDQLSLGTTFVLGDKVELPSEEVGGMCNSFLALPGEKHGLHISPLSTTFLYENSTSDCANDAQFIYSEAELHNESKPLSTPDQVMTFDTPLFSVKDKDICTSTPVQNLGTHLPNLASFAVSPCTENTGSPAPQPVLRKKNSVSPKQFERGTPVSGNKVTKMGVDKFPKSNMSSVRCKMRRAEGSSLLLDKPLQMNAKQEGNKVGSRPSPTRINNGATTPVSAVLNPQRKLYIRANKDLKDGQRNSFDSEESQAKSRTVHASLSIDTSKQAPAVHCSPASCDTEQEPTGHANTDPKVNIANTTFCYPDKSPPKNDKVVTKPASKTNTIKKVKSGSTLGHEKSTPSTPSTRPRSSSESSTALSRLFRMAKPQRLSASFSLSISKNKNPKSQTKLGNQENSSPSKPGSEKESTETNCRKVKKIVLVSHSSTLSSASCTETKTRVRGQPSPNLTGRASTSKSSAASQKTTAPMAATPLNMQRSGASDRERSRTNLLLKSKIKGNTKTPGDTAPAVNNKPGSSQRLQTPSRSSVMDPPPTFGPRLQPRKVCGPSRIQPGSNESGVHRETSDSTKTTQVSGAASRRSTPCKFPILKARLNTTPAKTTPAKASAPVLTALCKTTGPTKGLPNCHISSQKRTTTNTTKLIRFTTS
ncbi:uncharacterized protein LOC129411521, partial [Boleophthalmus pectinirostris]|uniref:uncharacterized protein LOC129411521 n=1 Tax=Boleophthalmus pectinirostris TaxID=150288 RepID=UPI00242E5BAC